jgi:hypothetical protein
MTRLILPAYIGLIPMMSASEGQTNQKQTIPELWKHEHSAVPCGDSPIPGRRPANWDCAILARGQFSSLPPEAVVLRVESFPTREAAEPVATPASTNCPPCDRSPLLTKVKSQIFPAASTTMSPRRILALTSMPCRFSISILDRKSGTCSRVSSAWNCRIGSCALAPEKVRSYPGTLQGL